MRFDNLNDWLTWQESLNPVAIDLGLDRVAEVLSQAGLSSSFNCPLITVAGTNGKGSVVAMLEAIALEAGLKVCSYTSPHLFHYNERIKINGQPVADKLLCEAFERIDQARKLPNKTSALTYFEFGTLAAIDIFSRQQADLVILEVGLGGRLDAVNIMDADVSVITSLAIDHIDWLGDNRESIGFEKAGIFRSGKTAVCGEPDVPASVLEHANKIQCPLLCVGRDFSVKRNSSDLLWSLKSPYADLSALAAPCLQGDFQYLNAATAIVALQALANDEVKAKLLLQGALSSERLSAALQQIKLTGRFQQLNLMPAVYVDVAHNPQAAQALAAQLEDSARENSKTWAILAMLADKDTMGVLLAVSAHIDYWCFAGLENVSRGLTLEKLLEKLPQAFFHSDLNTATNPQKRCKITQQNAAGTNIMQARTVAEACRLVMHRADKNDRVIIFGSFYTVAQAMNYFAGLDSDERTDSCTKTSPETGPETGPGSANSEQVK